MPFPHAHEVPFLGKHDPQSFNLDKLMTFVVWHQSFWCVAEWRPHSPALKGCLTGFAGIVLFAEYFRSSRRTYIFLVTMLAMFVAAVGLLIGSAGERKN